MKPKRPPFIYTVCPSQATLDELTSAIRTAPGQDVTNVSRTTVQGAKFFMGDDTRLQKALGVVAEESGRFLSPYMIPRFIALSHVETLIVTLLERYRPRNLSQTT